MGGEVAFLTCESYAPGLLDEALERAAALSGMPDLGGLRVLVKPNILNSAPSEKAVATNPEFVAAVVRLAKRHGASHVFVGDSPAWQSPRTCATNSGIMRAVVAMGAEWVDFVPGPLRDNPGGREIKRFALASVLDEVDLTINLPKLKTHRLMRYTGAIKNLFGLLPGLAKSGMHLRFPDVGAFGRMLVDLAGAAGPCFTFMDGIVAMEGEGPGSGSPRNLGFVLASGDMAALDWVAAGLIGYAPEEIPYLVDALERGGR
jgi:uncharacterized protein (DUF362 family)